MPNHTQLTQLKKELAQAGFEVFRTRGDEVILAERPRDNLILDAGVSLRAASPEAPELRVSVVLRVQKGDFPNDDDARLFARVRGLAEPALTAGFVETNAGISPVADPGNPTRVIATFYEVSYSKNVANFEAAIPTLHFALSLEKRVMR